MLLIYPGKQLDSISHCFQIHHASAIEYGWTDLGEITGLSKDECIYFCGNSLGLQPRATSEYISAQLDTWSSIGVNGHFRDLEDSPLRQWQLLSEQAAGYMSRLVGAAPEEVAAMGTLTSNLHLLLASFYTPTENRYKILMDWKAFPSDHVCLAPYDEEFYQ